jgi:hypothetical protein
MEFAEHQPRNNRRDRVKPDRKQTSGQTLILHRLIKAAVRDVPVFFRHDRYWHEPPVRGAVHARQLSGVEPTC